MTGFLLSLDGCASRELSGTAEQGSFGSDECTPGETRNCACDATPTGGESVTDGVQICEDEGVWGDCGMCPMPGDGDGDCLDVDFGGDFNAWDDEYGGDPGDDLLCGLELNCPQVEFYSSQSWTCSEYGQGPEYDPQQAACVIDGLRDGVPGAYRLIDCGSGPDGHDIRIEVFEDGSVLYYRHTSGGYGFFLRGSLRVLPGPTYFEACSISNADEFVACIDGILEAECLPGPSHCP